MSESNLVIHAQAVHKRFHDGGLDVSVLRGVSVSVERGQTLAVVGASGSGKSTLLHLLGGLEQPSTGRISVMGQSWADMSPSAQGHWRNQHVGFVYQFHHLLAELTAVENVAVPLRLKGLSARDAREQAHHALHAMGLAERAHHRPAQLSGGERQRVAVARALVTRPACLLADEPTGNLDVNNAHRVLDQLLQLVEDQGTALVLVTHDTQLAQRCRHQMVLGNGAQPQAIG